MSSIDTYTGLVAFVTDHLQLDTDTVGQIDNLLRMAELKLNRAILAPEREQVSTAYTVAGTQTVGLPSNFRQIRQVMVDSDYPLAQVSLNVLQGSFAGGGNSGKPQVYAISDSSLYFGPIPDSDYLLSMTYLADITPLTATNTTNWLTEVNPDAYVYALLAECEAFRGNLDAAGRWLAMLDAVIAEINRQGVKFRNSAPVRLRSPVVV